MILLTEHLVFDPINNFSQPQRSCVESELVTRIIGVSASIFAAIDLVISLVGMIGLSTYLATKLICCCCDDIDQDYQILSNMIGDVGKFALLTLTGSVFGIISPQCLSCSCSVDNNRFGPASGGNVGTNPPIVVAGGSTGTNVSIPPITVGGGTLSSPPITVVGGGTPSSGRDLADPVVIDEEKEQEALLDLTALAQSVQEGGESSPFDNLRDFFARSSIGTQMRFIDMFSEGSIPEYAKVRKELADVVFQPKSLADHDVKWLSNLEIEEAATKLASTARLTQTLAAKHIPWTDKFHKGYFFHATPVEANVQGILGAMQIEVRHQQAYKGAFVSTVPEIGFGNYIFAFRENIAHNSSLNIGFSVGGFSYWIGFSQGIPIDPSTLAYIMVYNRSDADNASLQARCKTWAGWDIPVVSYQDMQEHLEELKTIGRGIPKSWPKPIS
ncbi:MAG: hypothetical protein HY860_01620 [Chlamydiales bacterium]|nr:hypothetical protein [Chlamydiales bacterium]